MFKLLLLLFSFVIGGLVQGLERKVRARMQNRQGPPLLQPFYDMFKLMDKRPMIIHQLHASFAIMHFLAMAVVVGMVIYEQNLLYIIFLHLLATAFLVIAAYSVNSIYSHLGANRELLVLLVYEPIFIFIAVYFYLLNDSFSIEAIAQSTPKLQSMLLLLPLFIAALIKLSKSPFDNAHAHQEIIGGVEIEYSGIVYEFLYMAKWLEYFFIFALFWLFGGNSLWLSLLLICLAFLLLNLIDNATARVQMKVLLWWGIAIGYGVSFAVLLGESFV